MNPADAILLGTGIVLLGLVYAARLLMLARWPVGRVFYLANVVWEIFPKKLKWPRSVAETLAAALGLACLRAGGASWTAVGAWAAVGGALVVHCRIVEGAIFRELRVPRLAYALEGPFVARLPVHRLGVLWTGRAFELELVVSNTGRQPWPEPVDVRLEVPPGWLRSGAAQQTAGALPAGGVGRAKWTVCPTEPCGPGEWMLHVSGDGYTRGARIAHDGCRHAAAEQIVAARISRYPGGRRSAFLWRGDMDLYDRRTFQSIAGLETTLGLAARYAFPQTMCLSTRLSLDEAAAREFAAHEGVGTGWEEIPAFIQWLRDRVELRHRAPWPAAGAHKPYVMELGNHGHLHYDTAAAAAPENGWTSRAKMGAGRYPWQGDDVSSFGEQRDNVAEAARWCKRWLDFVPRSWAKPGRCNDADTARAVAAAGGEVLSGSDIRARDNVLFQPPPHHPGGTDAVELTSRYPPDPQTVLHVFMLVFWLNRSRRRGVPMVFMCHQHMRQWEGPACARFTEFLLRRVLLDFHGEFHVDTLFGVGKYWREVLSPRTRRLSVALDGARLTVENRSDVAFERVPIDLELAGGGRAAVMVSVPSGQIVEVDLREK